MGRQISPKTSGNDNIQTPDYLAKKIIDKFSPDGKILEPAKGNGSFYNLLKNCDWCEISENRDFFDYKTKGNDWIITNPPFSKIRKFLIHSYKLETENILFLMPVNHLIALRARIRDMKFFGYGIKEICLVETPSEFPITGFQYCVYHIRRNYIGNIIFSELQ